MKLNLKQIIEKLGLRKPNINDLAIFIIVFSVISGIYYYGSTIRNEIKKNGIDTIGKFVGTKKYPKSVDFIFKFYIDGKETKSSISKVENCKCKIGKFYLIRYSKKYPDYIEVSFKDEIKDKIKILNSGFKESEIE